MDEDIMLEVSQLDPDDRAEIDFILNSSDFSDEEKNLLVADKLRTLRPFSAEDDDYNE